MTTVLTQAHPKRKRIPGNAAIFAARLVLFWEWLWPAIVPALAIPFLYVMISLFDLWRLMPVWLHGGLLIIGIVCFAGLLIRDLKSLRFPGRRAGQTRLEKDGGVDHAALQALDDAPFASSGDEASPLWRAHLAAMRERARKARLKSSRANFDTRDPWGLRFIALGLLAIAFIAGGENAATRLARGIDPGAHAGGGKQIADIWIEPPAYANRAPVYLLRAGEKPPADAAQVNTPEGSIIVAQINGGGRAQLTYQTTSETLRGAFDRNGAAGRAEIAIGESGVLDVKFGAQRGRWPIGIIADDAPHVAFIEPPTRTDDARLDFTITIEDDYGIADARLVMRLAPDQERPLDAPAINDAAFSKIRSVTIDGVSGKSGERNATLDLQSDPWAGLQVLAKVVVRDSAGQEGTTAEVPATLPTRTFFNPIARAVIEQRQTLAVAAGDWPRAARSFDAMTVAPEIFYAEKPTNFLLLRSAFWRVMRQDENGFDDAIEKFWPLALQLEDEAVELARQRLEAAQEALRQALERGASEEEIARLVEELREAMNDYLTALAQSGRQAEGEPPRNAQQLEQSDLDDMLNAIRDLSQQGANNAARQMLSDLENMLKNLQLSQNSAGQSGQGSGQGSEQGSEGQSAGGSSGQAGEMIGRQRELADDTFERGRQFGENGDDLAAREGELGSDLDDMLSALQGEAGADPSGEATRALGQARSAMREAENALSASDFAAASDAMERAIGNLREGAEALAREQMRQAREGGQGEDGRRGEGTDPLGRPAGEALGEGVDVPGEGEAGRTRAVIDELRRRLGEPGREEDEKEYLERLLERF